MIIFLLILLICILILFVIFSYLKWKNKTKYKFSSDKKKFLVQNNTNEPRWISEEVANRLSRLANKIDFLVNEMYKESYPSKEISLRLKERWSNIRSKPNGFRETSSNENTAGYTVDKGEEMRICVRDKKQNNKLEDENVMMFVTLHECAHLMSKSYGHNKEFKENFASITKKAIQLEIYQYENYRVNNKVYCGVDITNSSI